jgi:KipI family sensor histidine kinase inhibitor
MTAIQAHPLGDFAVALVFGTERSAGLLERIHLTASALAAANVRAVEDIVPSYLSIAVFYDCLERSYSDMAAELVTVCERVASPRDATSPGRAHVLPTRYDGLDLSDVAAATGLSVEDVIARHSGRAYRVDIIGFVPGFAYLSELDASLALARRQQPRPRITAGSVAIAGLQTAVYPLVTPGGWHIIGTTDAVMFDPLRAEPSLLRAGDTVRFERIR